MVTATHSQKNYFYILPKKTAARIYSMSDRHLNFKPYIKVVCTVSVKLKNNTVPQLDLL